MVALLASMVRLAARPISDPDAFWHLRVGYLLRTGEFSLFRTGPLSSFATESWIPRDWVPQLVASQVEAWFGLPGVAWLYGLSLVAFVLVTYLLCRRWSDALPAAVATGLCVVGAIGSLSQRPQMVSFVLLVVVVHAWLRTADDLRPRWWLVPLMWVWAGSHGMWYLGIAVGGAVVVGLMLDRRADLRRLFVLALVPFLGLAAAAITPAGPWLLLAVFQTGDKWRFATEWGPPDFTSVNHATAMLMVALTLLPWTRVRAPMAWVHLLLVLLATALVLMAERTVAAGAAMVVLVLASTLQGLFHGRAPAPLPRSEVVTLVAAAGLAAGALAITVPITSDGPAGVPEGLSAELDALEPGSAVINAYELGGWLHWRHPELNTVIDGFTDGYSVEALEAWTSAVVVAPGWQQYVRSTGADHALLSEESPLTEALTDRLGWRVVEVDEGYVLLEAGRG
ncbi:hypothetical protein [Aquipuribacter sp. SD81]|uniref:hypothetical protein n=1 Tax=Aquipuribacter sp. SD81 TaxID=3127703 RepID=UPI003017692E